jgi:hypothetical protein
MAGMLKAENAYKFSAWLLYSLMIVIAFFISLGDADFDFTKLIRAQFWVDFLFTFGGGMLLKYAFGKWGDFEGHKNVQVIKAIVDINEDHRRIEAKKLQEELENYIDHSNKVRKTQALKQKTFKKLRSKFSIKKKWKSIKASVLIYETMLLKDLSEEEKEGHQDTLDENNFEIDSFRWLKYSKIRKDALNTGFTNQGSDDEGLSYSEMYQLFGRNMILTILTLAITFILAITSVVMSGVTMQTVWIFITRIGAFSMNAYLGYAIGKSGVERLKLNVLKSIHKFLSTFTEVKGKGIVENKEVTTEVN